MTSKIQIEGALRSLRNVFVITGAVIAFFVIYHFTSGVRMAILEVLLGVLVSVVGFKNRS